MHKKVSEFQANSVYQALLFLPHAPPAWKKGARNEANTCIGKGGSCFMCPVYGEVKAPKLLMSCVFCTIFQLSFMKLHLKHYLLKLITNLHAYLSQ